MRVYCVPVGMLQTNCYILACEDTKKAVIVDPGDEGPKIDSLIKREGLDPVLVVNTHAHYDHIGADRYFHDKGIPIAIHRLDSKLMMAGGGAEILGSRSVPNPEPDRYLEEGDTIEFGNQKLSVIFTPGHSPGSISLYSKNDNVLFCGDALFCRSIGRTDLPGGDYDTLMHSLREKLSKLPGETQVFPGHGPDTDIEGENKFNPWLMR
ncbi:MAG: MBL fold metallo-hydrolase [Spirochaetia bacterium]|nr:MBL fold metallo-hydrolase [Spirochaetia bacterium]